CGELGLTVQPNAELRAAIDRMIGGIVGSLYLLMALLFVVASLGVVNTLTMNVQEQTRELGVLRALGMKRRQVAKLVLAQAAGLGVGSLVPGVVAGLGLAYLMNLATTPLLGQRIPFGIDPLFLAGCVVASVGVAVLAAVLPARQAA